MIDQLAIGHILAVFAFRPAELAEAMITGVVAAKADALATISGVAGKAMG